LPCKYIKANNCAEATKLLKILQIHMVYFRSRK